MHRMRLALAGSSVALAALVVPVATASAAAPSRSVHATSAAPVQVLACNGKTRTKPTNYVLSCADANAQWLKVSWSSWGQAAASGKGDLYQNDCIPDCASGHFHSYPATLQLGDMKKTAKYGLLYTQATFHYGANKTETFDLAS